MTFDVSIDLHYDGAWNDISGDVYQRDRIGISRGRRDEGSKTDPGKCQLTIDNTGGTYSPRNPESPLYDKIGRNTPLRVRQGATDMALRLPGLEGSWASTPDSASLDISGDIDVRAELTHPSWRFSGVAQVIAAKTDADGIWSWGFRLLSGGTIELAWTEDGSTRLVRGSTAAIPEGSGRLAMRATLDVDNGASGHTVTFYTADLIDGPWTQLGDPVVTSGVTSIAVNDADLTLGSLQNGRVLFSNLSRFEGLVHAFELRGGGTLVADVGYGSAAPGDRSFTDDAGLAWAVHGNADLTDLSVRMTGEVSEWPPRWDATGSDVHTPIEAAGILRRLGNINSPLNSALYRGTVASSPVAYWPMEDGEESTSLASGLDGGTPMSIVRTPELSAFDGFASSSAIPQLQDGQLVGRVPEYPSSDDGQAQLLLHAPDGGVAAEAVFLELRTTGSVRRVTVSVNEDGALRQLAYDETGVVLDDSGYITFAVNGDLVRFALELRQQGSDVNVKMATVTPGSDVAGVYDRTMTGQTAGAISRVTIGSSGLGDTAIGHVTVYPEIFSIFELKEELNAWRGEAAARRIQRLCSEQDIPLAITGDPDDTAALGPQSSDTLLSLLRESATADMGILGEMRDQVGLHYRTHSSLYNRTPALTLDYQAGQLSPPLEPTEDDKNLANDVAVQRRDGSSSRAVQQTGPLSVLPPPDGVGRYDSSLTLNLHTDEQTTQQAAWRMHLGTIDELRYPTVTVLLHGNPDLVEAIKRLDQGDRIHITNLPDWVPPGDAELTLEGTSESLDRFEWSWQVNTSPAKSHDVFELNSSTLGRLDTGGTRLHEGLIADTENNIEVEVYAGMLWTTDTAEYPFDIEVGGERMTATDIQNPGLTFELESLGFEDGVLDPFTTTGAADWFTQSTEVNSGSFAAQSGNIADLQRSQLSVVVDVPEGASVSFARKVSSESTFDFLEFYIDGTFQDNWSGSVAWAVTTEYPLSVGEHELTWVYTKDGSTSSGSDAAWVDDVTLSGTVQEFIVDRGVNGVSKEHSTGAEVRLVDTAVLAIGQSGAL